MSRVSDRYCKCDVCQKWHMDHLLKMSRTCESGICDICRHEWEADGYFGIVPNPPPALREFGFRRVCWACRNCINAYVMGNWGLCWAKDEIQTLKWAILDYWLRSWYNQQFRWATRNFPGERMPKINRAIRCKAKALA